MDLAELIINHSLEAQADAGNFAAVLTALATKSIEQTDATLRTTVWLSVEFNSPAGPPGWTEADLIIQSLEDSQNPPRVRRALDTMTNREHGLDLSADEVQQMIPLLAVRDGWPAGLADRLLEFGRRTVSPLESIDRADATEGDLQSAWLAYRLSGEVTTQQNETINPAVASGDRAAIVAALRSAADALEGG